MFTFMFNGFARKPRLEREPWELHETYLVVSARGLRGRM